MPESKQRPSLQTDRLILRPFELADAKDVQKLAGNEAIAKNVPNIPHPYEDGMAEIWIRTHQPQFEAGELCNFAITLNQTNELIGSIGLIISSVNNHAELGYWVGVSYWNQGYCTEAAGVLLEYGFSELKLHRIHAHHISRNLASGRVMIKLGMKHEAFLREHALVWDNYENIDVYGILQKEWVKR